MDAVGCGSTDWIYDDLLRRRVYVEDDDDEGKGSDGKRRVVIPG